jgi:hypothetical protein
VPSFYSFAAAQAIAKTGKEHAIFRPHKSDSTWRDNLFNSTHHRCRANTLGFDNEREYEKPSNNKVF